MKTERLSLMKGMVLTKSRFMTLKLGMQLQRSLRQVHWQRRQELLELQRQVIQRLHSISSVCTSMLMQILRSRERLLS